MRRGFSLVEIVICLAIVAIVTGLSLSSFIHYRNREVLKAAALDVAAVLADARAKTVVAEGDSVYGVHFDVDQVVVFAGGVYNPNDGSNRVSALPTTIRLATTTLGANEIIFSRLSGDPSVAGIISIYQAANPSASTTVTINGAGIISSP